MTARKKPAVTQTIVTAQVPRNWLREAISDGDGLADAAYIAILALTAAAIAAIIFLCCVAVFDWSSCQPVTTVSKGETSVASVIPCRFDPLPLGQAAGLIFGAFAALIASLSGYMYSTKRSKSGKQMA